VSPDSLPFDVLLKRLWQTVVQPLPIGYVIGPDGIGQTHGVADPHRTEGSRRYDVAWLSIAQFGMDRCHVDAERVLAHEPIMRHSSGMSSRARDGSLEQRRAEARRQVVQPLRIGERDDRIIPVHKELEGRQAFRLPEVGLLGSQRDGQQVVHVVAEVLGRVFVEPLRGQCVGGNANVAFAGLGFHENTCVQNRIAGQARDAVAEGHPRSHIPHEELGFANA